VSDYGLDHRAIKVRFPAKARDFSSSLCVQTGSGAHPASCTMGTGSPFPGDKARPGRDSGHSPPFSAEVVNEYELYILSPRGSIGVLWDCFTFTLHLQVRVHLDRWRKDNVLTWWPQTFSGFGGVNWIYMTQDRNRRWILMNTVHIEFLERWVSWLADHAVSFLRTPFHRLVSSVTYEYIRMVYQRPPVLPTFGL
jgi:hypothetical protein